MVECSIEHVFEKLAELFTAKELEKVAQIFLAKIAELLSAPKEPNEENTFSRRDETSTVLGNLVNLARPGTGTFNSNWILDSGASRHVTGASGEFASYTPFSPTSKETIQTADGTAQPVRCTPSITLSSVLYVPSFPVNLVSLSSLVDHMDCRVTLDRENCLIEDRKTGRMLGSGIRRNGLWFLDRRTDKSCTALVVTSEEEAKVILQHCRLGHMSFETMCKASPNIMSKVDKSKLVCDACEFGKHTRAPYISRGLRSTLPFALVHSDVWTSPVVSISGMKYFVTFIDCYSRMTWIYLMRHKTEVLKCFKDFYACVKNQFNTQVRVIRTDNGTEYVNNEFANFLSAEGILHQTSCPDTPPQNGVAERKNRHLLEVARSLMYTMNVPKFLWSEAVLTATYLINRIPSRVLQMKTPYEMLFGKNEFIVPPKVFGCTCFVRDHRPSVGKLDPRAVKCIFVGYSSVQKGYKCWSPSERRLFVSIDVTFRESEPFYGEKTDLSSLFSSLDSPIIDSDHHEKESEASDIREGDNQPRRMEIVIESVSRSTNEPNSISVDEASREGENGHAQNVPAQQQLREIDVINGGSTSTQANDSTSLRLQNKDTLKVYTRRNFRPQPEATELVPNVECPLAPEHESQQEIIDVPSGSETYVQDPSSHGLPIALRKGTRAKAGVPPSRYEFEHDISNYVSYAFLSPAYRAFVASLQSAQIPRDWKEAKQDPKWREAMLEELNALEKNKTWDLVKLPTGKKAVSCKWVFTVKQTPGGKVERYKARLVARGYSQTYGIDYDETFTPVAKMNTVRTLISCAANFGWPLHQLDVKNAFLHGDLQEEVYMEIPPGYSKPEVIEKVCRLKKSLYGLKQSPRAWFDRFKRALCGMQYKQCNGDHTLFYRHLGRKITVLAVYVDDIIITGDDEREIIRLKENLSKEFEVKDLGQLRYFLGIEIARNPKGIILSQRKYVLDLLSETGVLGCRPVSTPIDSNHKLCAESGYPVNKERYQRLVGRLIYLCHTRPDISYAVSVVSRYMHDPRSGHLDAVYRILRYLKSSPGKGLMFKSHGHLNVEGYCDADWASCLDDRRSTSGYCVFVGGNLVSWRSKKQSVVSRSTAEAEYRAMSLGVSEMLWVRNLLSELNVLRKGPFRVWCDNKSAINIANNPVQHDRTKHVEIDRFFIKERIDNGILELSHVNSCDQVADCLTKGLGVKECNLACNKMGMIDIYHPS